MDDEGCYCCCPVVRSSGGALGVCMGRALWFLAQGAAGEGKQDTCHDCQGQGGRCSQSRLVVCSINHGSGQSHSSSRLKSQHTHLPAALSPQKHTKQHKHTKRMYKLATHTHTGRGECLDN